MNNEASHFIFPAKVAMNQSHTMHPGMALGGVALALFGAMWLAGASGAYLGGWPALAGVAAGALAIAAWALATFRARRRAYGGAPDDGAGTRLRKGFMLINAVQWSLIGLAIPLLNAVGHGDWIRPVVIFVVGVHFVPLARMLDYRGYYWTTLGLVLVAGCDVMLKGGHAGLALAATGVVLWASAVGLLCAMQWQAARDTAAAPQQAA